MVLLGGGWKEFRGAEITKEQLFSMAGELLGIPDSHCREFFGAVEHPALYCSCKNHHFHVPVCSRVLIRDVQTLKPLGYGEPGLLNLISPLAHSMPLTSVLTDDIAVLRKGSECGCGIDAPYFEILRRARHPQAKICAADAAGFLNL